MFGRGKGQHYRNVISLLYYIPLPDLLIKFLGLCCFLMFNMSQLVCWNCKENTKYQCLKCAQPVCNHSSSCHVAASEDEPEWKAGHCVAFCVPCSVCSREPSEIATESIQSTSSSSNSSSAKPSKNKLPQQQQNLPDIGKVT